jgi:hypothetical protein
MRLGERYMAPGYKKRTGELAVKEYPTEWAWYPADADAEAGQEEQLEVSRIESVTSAEEPKYLTNAA